MAINELIKIVRPPAQPLEVEPSRWREVEADLKVQLPRAYRDYVTAYGSGQFVVGKKDAVRLMNPLDHNYLPAVREKLEMFREYRASEGRRYFKFNVFPKQPGVFPIGETEQAFTLFYLLGKDADELPVLVQGHDNPTFHRYETSLSTFLVSLFSGDTTMPPWSVGYFRGEPVTFEPRRMSPPPPPVEYDTVYGWYVKNGHKADFWITTPASATGGGSYHIKRVAGMIEGQLRGAAPDYGKPSVVVDIYLWKTLYTQNYEMPESELSLSTYFMIPSPLSSSGN